MTIVGEEDLSRVYWNQKRKLGVTMHFLEVMKLQLGTKNSMHCFVLKSFLELLLVNYLCNLFLRVTKNKGKLCNISLQ